MIWLMFDGIMAPVGGLMPLASLQKIILLFTEVMSNYENSKVLKV